MKLKRIIIVSSVVIIIILANLWGLTWLRVYKFESTNGGFYYSIMPSKGDTHEKLVKRFEEYKNQNPQNRDQELHRTFKINLLEFWNWAEYITKPYYKYPYTPRTVYLD